MNVSGLVICILKGHFCRNVRTYQGKKASYITEILTKKVQNRNFVFAQSPTDV